MPVLVRVEIDDEYEDERVTQVVLALGDDEPLPSLGRARPYDGITLIQDEHGQARVYNGEPAADMDPIDDHWAREAIRVAEYRLWPPRRAWEEGPHPVDDPGCYDPDDESDVDGEEPDDELEWTSLR
jgi:hypothetical protein